ncbi:LRR receptor-like serine/threonine-protein kinase GSO1 [Triticum dicoccoides]|uniref:LRR receptor-like serine/threonine-protein kinase GSO1 n=1 Tax=Triticum dicoccoides TaxID=85692 RepID=UPI00188F6E21|nr:LRR receptor-like serine/threonine-protein kinase GSO1 [Triticum dicoccoides]
MHRSTAIAKLALLLLATAAVSCGFFVVAHAHARKSCWPRERDALLALKQGINDTDGVLASWQKLRHDCCGWTGVACSNETGHVTELHSGLSWLFGQISPSLLSLQHLEYLDLSTTSLLGPNGSSVFPDFLSSLHNLRHLDLAGTLYSGRVPARLSNLSNLEYLDLSGTSLHGRAQFLFSYKNLIRLDLSNTLFSGTLPPQLGKLSKLEYLDLTSTLFSGTLPPQLGNLSNLRHLDLSYMQNIHTADVSWLTHLHFLEYLDMSDINLGTADVFPVANTIPTLKDLILSNCSLPNANQPLTHLNLTKLERLDLYGNYLGHRIDTSWFWNITGITGLDLDETYLYGPFPDALGGMTSLQFLSFANNGNSATIMVDMKNLCDLELLRLDGSLAFGNITEFLRKLPQCSSNKFLSVYSNHNNMTGMLPDMVGHLTNLQDLSLSNNSITGAIPSGLRNLTSLYGLDLTLNQLTGQIPMLPRNLTRLAISMNSLSGPLPLDFGAPDLTDLNLFSNCLTGHVPRAICELKNLSLLDLSNNLFEGEFPWCSAMPSMEFLILSNNNLSGNFPSWIQNSSQLVFLDLAVNKFYGTLPMWIGELVNLRFLLLNHNMFYGDIPANITNLIQLQYFSLASNNISGSIPSSLSRLIAMTLEHPQRWTRWYVQEVINKDILSVVMKRQNMKYDIYRINEMYGIDISLNHLTGGIPDEITSLNGLFTLNLSWNHLSGKIPTNTGDMKSLESLDLSRNNLSSENPTSLSDLTYLSSLDLSYNNLVGRIPTGRQLDTLYAENPSMYSGNNGLCGPPLKKNCPGNNALEHGDQQRRENGYDPVVFFYFGLTAGFVAGLWIVFCALLFKRAWRSAYFGLFDKLHDNVYVFIVVTWGMITSKTTTS